MENAKRCSAAGGVAAAPCGPGLRPRVPTSRRLARAAAAMLEQALARMLDLGYGVKQSELAYETIACQTNASRRRGGPTSRPDPSESSVRHSPARCVDCAIRAEKSTEATAEKRPAPNKRNVPGPVQ